MNVSKLIQLRFWSRRRLPVMLQTEAAECGLACLGMIASYWGHVIDIPNLRRRFSLSLKGANLRGIMVMAEAMQLRPRALKLGLDSLNQLKLPCILHWDFNHFVVLNSVNGGRVTIHDPAVGARRLDKKEFSKHFTGVALELSPTPEFQPNRNVQDIPLRTLMGQVIGLKRGLLQLLGLGLAWQVCTLIAPFYVQWTVDEALLAADRDLITVLGLGFILLVMLQTSLNAVRSWVTTAIAVNMNIQWLSNAFAHLLKLPLSYFEKRHTGDVVSRFSSIQTIQHTVTTQFVEGLVDGVLVVGTFSMMWIYNGLLTAVACLAVVTYILIRCAIFRGLRDATSEQIIHAAKQNTNFMESVRGIQSIRLSGRGDVRRSCWVNLLTDQFNAELRVERFNITYRTASFLLFNLERVIIIWLGALAVLDGLFSVGMLFAFLSYKDQFSQRMSGLVDKLFELRMLRLHGERLGDILHTDPEPDLNDVEFDLSKVNPTIEMRNVSFRYADGEPFVIKGVDLTVQAGECVAITGASGSGKTTLMKLLLGLLEPTDGEVLVGGVKINHLGVSNYRRLLGTVMQDETLFAGSIADNISFFDPVPEHDMIQSCAHLSAIHAEIAAMPMGYNTLIGDIGSGLSGGQKQRILLARALYRRPKLLVLDEATSHLDIGNEQLVNSAIKQLALTRVIVAHRPETIAMAQRVVVLQNGTVHEAPNPLMEVGGGTVEAASVA